MFILHRKTLERTGNLEAIENLKGLDFDISIVDSLAQVDSSSDQPIVLWGSIQSVRSAVSSSTFTPGAYYHPSRYACSHYYPLLKHEWLANGDGFYLTFGEFIRRAESLYAMLGTDKLFIRPDSGNKVFTGLVISQEEFKYEVNSLLKLTSVTESTMIVIAPAKSIEAEYRFFIVNGEVVTGSRYSLAGEISVSPVISEDCRDLAMLVADHAWQIDLAYACDVALVGGFPKVMELNAFSTSGWYASDLKVLLNSVACVARLEYNQEISITD